MVSGSLPMVESPLPDLISWEHPAKEAQGTALAAKQTLSDFRAIVAQK